MTQEEIFGKAIQLPADQQSAFLDGAFHERPEDRAKMEAMLAAHQWSDSLLDIPDQDSTESHERAIPGSLEQIGNYKLLQKIGEGGFGAVYMAEQLRPLKRKVALKVIKPGMDSHAVIARFEAERQALAMMDHSNIARVFDGGVTVQGRPYFVMELVKGVPITTYCDDNHLRTSERLKLFIDVCKAVQHAHQKGIIHRDIKPSNVMVTLHDGQPVIKVIDFGVAKAMNTELTEKTLFTAYGQMIGTPQYMSPEQAEMSGLDVDTRSDVYSLGVLLYELLTGTTPLEAETLRSAGYVAMQKMIKETHPPKPSARISTSGDRLTHIAAHRSVSPERLRKEVRGDLDWIVMKALDKDRNRRYDTPNRLADDLDRYLRSSSVEARPPSLLYRLQKHIRRNRASLAIATAIIAMLCTALYLINGQRQLAQRALNENQRLLTDIAFNEACNGEQPAFEDAMTGLKLTNAPDALCEVLYGIADVTSGQTKRAVQRLTAVVEENPHDELALGTLIWAAFYAGDYSVFDRWSLQMDQVFRGDSDMANLFAGFAYLYQPGAEDERMLKILDGIIDRHPRWGFAYASRASGYEDLFHRTRNPDHLNRAIDEITIAEALMPRSRIAKTSSLEIHATAVLYVDAFPDTAERIDRQASFQHASEIAQAIAPQTWDLESCATALMFYRSIDSPRADILEAEMDQHLDIYQCDLGELFAKRQYEALKELADTDELGWDYVWSLVCMEEGNSDDARKHLARLRERTAGNGGWNGITAVPYLLMGDLESVKEISSREGYYVWEWDKKIADYHHELANHPFADNSTRTEELLADAAPFPPAMCCANFAAGVYALVDGKREKAKKYFQEAVATGRYGWHDYVYAKAFLKRLNDPQDDFPAWKTEKKSELSVD